MALVTTIHGDMDDSLLERRVGSSEKLSATMPDIQERISWVEYWLDGVLVHRSAHVILINLVPAGAKAGSF